MRSRSHRVPVHLLSSLFGLALFVAALAFLHHELRHYHYHDIVRALHQLPNSRVLLAFGLVVLDYFVLTWFDFFGFFYIEKPMPYSRVAPASFTAYAFSHNLGFSVLSGGAVRYRWYSALGVSAGDVARIILFCGVTFILGFLIAGGTALFLVPPELTANLYVPFTLVRVLGAALLAAGAGYFLLVVKRKRPFRILDWEYSPPRALLAGGQLVIGVLDWLLAASVLFVLLPESLNISYIHFLGLYCLAFMAGMISTVPGGLGVFETVLLAVVGGQAKTPELVGSLIAFRAIYYLLPLVGASVMLFTYEVLDRRRTIVSAVRQAGRVLPRVAPQILAAMTFLGGAILLLTDVAPSSQGRLRWLNDVLPLAVIEVSHFTASLIGAGLLILARGIQRRLDGAYWLSLILLACGAVAALLRGFDYDEFLALSALFLILLPCQKYFYRKASLINEPFTSSWALLVLLILLCAGWLGMFSYKHVEYSKELWWKFALKGDAPRFLRAAVGAATLTLLFALARILRSHPATPQSPAAEEMDQVYSVVMESPRCSAHLALLGDKSFLFNTERTAFLMYGVEGRSWISMGDPVGPAQEATELAWRFHELSDKHSGHTAFYQVRPENLTVYLDLGMSLLKLGEEGLVPLKGFSLEGGERKNLRHTLRSVEKGGATFELFEPDLVPSIIPDLRRISNEWMEEKKSREKQFSMGSFDETYLTRHPIGVVRKNGKIVAFANLWRTNRKEEVSADLMRYSVEAPPGVMEFLFLKLMLWAADEGYTSFSLGMAPLSGMEDRALAPLWNRLGSLVFRHGEHFYNFQGLRQYKEKFHPVWEPRYLASTGGITLPRVLTDVASLISGGLWGMISK